jgi:hypothetical protein
MGGRVSALISEGVGMALPQRRSDCSGKRPGWYPFQVNVCDEDTPDPIPLTPRQKSIGPPKPIPWRPE